MRPMNCAGASEDNVAMQQPSVLDHGQHPNHALMSPLRRAHQALRVDGQALVFAARVSRVSCKPRKFEVWRSKLVEALVTAPIVAMVVWIALGLFA